MKRTTKPAQAARTHLHEPLPLTAVQVTHPIFHRMVRTFSGLTAGTILLLGIISFLIAQSILSSRILADVAAMAAFREDILEDAVRMERERTSLIAVRQDVQALGSLPDPLQRLEELLAVLRRQNVPVMGITLFGTDRSISAHTGEISAPLLSEISTSTIIPFIDRKLGWMATDVFVPLTENGRRTGYLAVRYDSAPVLATLFSPESLGKDSHVLLGTLQGGEAFVLHHSRNEPIHSFRLGAVDDPYLRNTPLTLAVQGGEGVARTRDERGRDVFAAYRFIPSLGWGMAVEVPRRQALQGVVVLGISLSAAGLLLLVLAGYLAFTASRSITAPLSALAKKMQTLDPKHWKFQRTIRTGDETEVLDASFADLTGRLRVVYDHLEETVAERTEELRRQSALDRAILDTVEHGIIVTDAHGKITDANPASLRLLQMETGDFMGKKAIDVLVYAQRRKPITGTSHPVSKVLENHKPFKSPPAGHASLLRKNQTLLPVSFMVMPMLGAKKLLGAVIVFQDMTEERQIDYLKSEFISLASHQLRTPLASIRWYVELLGNEEKKDMNAAQKSYFNEIERASGRMANLLESLLHVAKLEGGGLLPELSNVDMNDVASQIAEEWTPISREKGIILSVQLPHAGTHLRTDPVLLQIVLQNFLNNALKYSTKGKEVHFRIRKEHERLILSVQDEGVGIPAAEQKRLFEKFFRAHNVRAMDTDGTGLGLYISKAIAERLGGTISFVSTEGKGSTFTLVLPTHPRHAA